MRRLMFIIILFFIFSVFTGCSKKESQVSPRQFYKDSEISNDDARRDTFDDFGEPIDYPDEDTPKIKDYYRLHYYHYV